MRHRACALATIVVLATGLAGCSSAADSSEPASSVPAGVLKDYATMAAEIAAEGGEKTSGEWNVGYIVEPAEAFYPSTRTTSGEAGSRPALREPATGETHHIEILPREASTGRLVPGVSVRLEVVDSTGRVVDAKPLEFLHSTFFHYANNFSVPAAGRYTLRATIGRPGFARHAEPGEAPVLDKGTTVEFSGVELRPKS